MRYFFLVLLFSISSGTPCFSQQKVEVLKKLDSKIATLKAIKGIEILTNPDTRFLKIVERVNENEALMEELFPQYRFGTYVYFKGPNSHWKDDQLVEVLDIGNGRIDFQTPKGLKQVGVMESPKGMLQKSFELYLFRKEAARIMYANFYNLHTKKIYVYGMEKGTRKGKKLSKYRAEVRAVWIPGNTNSSYFDDENNYRYNRVDNAMKKPYATDNLGQWLTQYGNMEFATVRNNKEIKVYKVERRNAQLGIIEGEEYSEDPRLSQSTIEFVDELYRGSYHIWEKYRIIPDGRLFDYKATTRDNGKTYGGRSGWRLD